MSVFNVQADSESILKKINTLLNKDLEIDFSNPYITKIYAILFREIIPFINKLSLLVGDSGESDDTFTNQYSYIIMKYIFLLTIYRLSVIINNIDEDLESNPDYNTIAEIVKDVFYYFGDSIIIWIGFQIFIYIIYNYR